MHQFIESAEDVIALQVSQRITAEDVDAIMNRLEPMLERQGKVHVFVESRGIQGIEFNGLPGYMARAVPLFGKLHRFGRVAVVADQAWVRLGAQLESAVLPFISYRTFTPEAREDAFYWVTTGGGSI